MHLFNTEYLHIYYAYCNIIVFYWRINGVHQPVFLIFRQSKESEGSIFL